MVDNSTFRVGDTRAGARVNASLINTGLGQGTIRDDRTFRTTCRGTAIITGHTRTNSLITDLSTLAIWSAWRWITWVCFDRG